MQAIVDKIPSVSSSAIVTAYHLLKESREIVKRWNSEVNEAMSRKSTSTFLNGPSAINHYHALGLIYQLRQNDKISINKLVLGISQNWTRSTLADCLLVRYAAEIILDGSRHTDTYGLSFYLSHFKLTESLNLWLRNRNDAINNYYPSSSKYAVISSTIFALRVY